MAFTWDQILSIMLQRRNADSVLIRAMMEIRDRANGDIIVPLPDVDTEPKMRPPAPRLIADGIDNTAMRAASARPNITVPAYLRDGRQVDKIRRQAHDRKRALYASWHHNALWDVQLYRSYRHLVGYGTCAMMAMPDHQTGRAKINIYDPLGAYPELRNPSDVRTPKNVGFIYGRSVDWILANYPEAEGIINGRQYKGRTWDTLWDMVEWIDEDDVVIGLLGPRMPAYGSQDARNLGYSGKELRRWKNKAGMVPGAVPRRVTLDRVAGQLTNIIPMTDLLDRLTALDIIAAEKAIFPDMVALGKDGRPPQLISGQWKDGRTGEVNLLTDSDVKLLQSAPGPLTQPVLDRLEQAARMAGGVSGLYSGDNPHSLRTGQAISQMGSFSIDPRIEETQKQMQRALTALNEGIMAVEKGYFSGKKIFGYTGWPTDDSIIEYDPGEIFDTFDNAVTYDFPGVDVAQISVTVGQMVGAGLMSKATARRKHPYMDDADEEEKRITMEAIKSAVLQAFQMQAEQGTLPINDAARVLELIQSGKSEVDAIVQAHQEAQERQAAQAQQVQLQSQQAQGGEGGPPMGAPGAQPGLAAPGQGAEQQPPAAIGAPTDSQQNFRHLLSALTAGRSL